MASIDVHQDIHQGQDHDDDHHDHDHHQSFISKYIFSQDHKIIARQFLITGIIWAVIGVLMSVLFRLQLAWPDESFPVIAKLLGKWGVDGKIDPEFYYALVTLHGTIMVFFVLTAGLSGTFSNLLIPLQIGARDMASGFINMLSYWFFFAAGCVMLYSIFVETGPASGGWTAYPPLSALESAATGSGLGMTLWLVSMSLFIFSTLLGGLNYVATVINLRTVGMTMWRLPLTIWSFTITAVIGILSFPVLLSACVLLIFDRSFGTNFYLSDIFINGEPLINAAGELVQGGSPILFQHLFWFLGHPEVYIIILPAMGIVSEVLSVNCKKPIFGYKAMVYSMIGIMILSFIVWAHHMFISGLNPFIGSIFVLFTLMIAVPSAIKVFNWIATIYKGNVAFNSQTLFSIGFVSLFISGGLTGIFLGNAALDIPLHDTYFVVAHFHIVMGLAAGFGMFAGIYHWFPKLFNGRSMNQTMGYMHFWLTFVGSYFIFWPMHYLGMSGVPRRYFSFKEFEAFSLYDNLNILITISALVVFFSQFIFLFNFFYSIFAGRKIKSLNPYNANTLEWTTPREPGHGNWIGPIPEVHRWPYDYSKDGRIYSPQHMTDEELEINRKQLSPVE